MEIIFTDTLAEGNIPEEYHPKPASKFLPEWYKDLDSYLSGNKDTNGFGETNATIKKCMPVFDSISAGYIISTYCDIYVKQHDVTNQKNELTVPDEYKLITTQPKYEHRFSNALEYHQVDQAINHPLRGTHMISYPKFINPWAIKTPPGYSVLFIQPVHRDSDIIVFPGVVDTDKYMAPVHFPFALKNADKFSGLIPAGTPLVQVIPFKRDSWTMKIGTEENLKEYVRDYNRIKIKIWDSYKSQFRQPKEYK